MFHVERCGKFFELWGMLRTAKPRSKPGQNPRPSKNPKDGPPAASDSRKAPAVSPELRYS